MSNKVVYCVAAYSRAIRLQEIGNCGDVAAGFGYFCVIDTVIEYGKGPMLIFVGFTSSAGRSIAIIVRWASGIDNLMRKRYINLEGIVLLCFVFFGRVCKLLVTGFVKYSFWGE